MEEHERIGGLHVAAGADRFSEAHPLGPRNLITFKLATHDTRGGLFVIEHSSLAKGGPPRHLHHEQDEWFYPLEGEYIIEVGDTRHQLKSGDSLLAPREVPHVWAHVGDQPGRLLIAFTPAGQMEAFFRAATKLGSMPPQNPELFRAHGMEVVGPPLLV